MDVPTRGPVFETQIKHQTAISVDAPERWVLEVQWDSSGFAKKYPSAGATSHDNLEPAPPTKVSASSMCIRPE